MTHVLVAFATRGGTTQTVAERLGSRLTEAGHEATIVPVQDNPDPAAYEAVVVGSGVLVGSVYSAAGEWLARRRRSLADRPVAVFVTCLGAISPDDEDRERARAYPDQLVDVLPAPAMDTAVFAGTYDPGRRGFWERIGARLNRAPRGDFRDWDKVDDWAEELAGLL